MEPPNPRCDTNNHKLEKTMKAISKQRLADKAGVSINTLNRWCKPLAKELKAMGLSPNARMLPPNVVKFLAEKFCIDL